MGTKKAVDRLETQIKKAGGKVKPVEKVKSTPVQGAKEAVPVKTMKNPDWLDVKGETLYKGSIVAVPILNKIGENQDGVEVRMTLGYVSNVTTRSLTVVTMEPADKAGEHKKGKIVLARKNISVSLIDKKQLKLTDKYHEAVRYAATMIGTD